MSNTTTVVCPHCQGVGHWESPCPDSHKFITFNINDYVQVRLTEYGRACLRRNHDNLSRAYGGKLPYEYTPPKEDKDGWSRWQMWSLMQELGPHMSMVHTPFETNIRIEETI